MATKPEQSRSGRDALGQFEHTHGHLNALVLGVATSLRAVDSDAPTAWEEVAARLGILRDELLRHFADEEEALFPFVRTSVPAMTGAVERLEAAHDAICGGVVRAHAAARAHQRALVAVLHERFERSYVEHSRAEAELFEALGGVLDERQRSELSRLLRGL
ncbi:MAG: hemerythrin domain-containing protein [Polyangiaceae bacterium]|jgi:iron-sulfur cluster repair protein YtfE (RIC family)